MRPHYFILQITAMCYTSAGLTLCGLAAVDDRMILHKQQASVLTCQLHWHEWQVQAPSAHSNAASHMNCSCKWSCVREHICPSLVQPSSERPMVRGLGTPAIHEPNPYSAKPWFVVSRSLWYQGVEWVLIIIMLK
uniref:Uncharacterized protein n=1 Tax=Micrurus lemniscatus lemniscatus TaxID=129467 RepID=A0A2D4I8V3_MICLE